MFDKKYLIIIGIIICLLLVCYFYHEMSKIKKSYLTAYQQAMALESKLMRIENKKEDDPRIEKKKPINRKNDSPALSITYQSDMVKKNGNLSVKYSDLSETEAKELLKTMEKPSINTSTKSLQQPTKTNPTGNLLANTPSMVGINFAQKSNIPMVDFSDFDNEKNIFMANSIKDNDETDTINVKLTDIIKKPILIKNDSETGEYEKILNGLISNSDNIDDEIDSDMARHISESIQYADIPSQNSLSPIPKKLKKKTQ